MVSVNWLELISMSLTYVLIIVLINDKINLQEAINNSMIITIIYIIGLFVFNYIFYFTFNTIPGKILNNDTDLLHLYYYFYRLLLFLIPTILAIYILMF